MRWPNLYLAQVLRDSLWRVRLIVDEWLRIVRCNLDSKRSSGKLTWKDFATLNVSYVDLITRKAEDGGPWVPGKIYTFLIVPLLVYGSFIASHLTGFRGICFESVEGQPLSSFDWLGALWKTLLYLVFYYVVFHSWFYINRWHWKKYRSPKSN